MRELRFGSVGLAVFNGHVNDASKIAVEIVRKMFQPDSSDMVEFERMYADGVMEVFEHNANKVTMAFVALVFGIANGIVLGSDKVRVEAEPRFDYLAIGPASFGRGETEELALMMCANTMSWSLFPSGETRAWVYRLPASTTFENGKLSRLPGEPEPELLRTETIRRPRL